MTYEDRLKHRELTDRMAALMEQLGEGADSDPVTREEAREIVALLEEVIGQLSPERRDRMMETVVDEATRRAGSMAPAPR